MRLSLYIKLNKKFWDDLEGFIRQGSRLGIRAIKAKEVKYIYFLYRKVQSDYNFINSILNSNIKKNQFSISINNDQEIDSLIELREYLNSLAVRSHYDFFSFKQEKNFKSIIKNIFLTYPANIRSIKFFIISSLLIFLLSLFSGFFTAQLNESLASSFISPNILEKIRAGELWIDSLRLYSSFSSNFIISNNINIAILSFVIGITIIGTIYIIGINGWNLGIILGLCYNYGILKKLLAFVFPHGLLELSIIIVSGGAGFFLSSAFFTSDIIGTREKLKENAIKGIKIMFVNMCLLIIAGIIEGFVSPSYYLRDIVKILFGILIFITYILYIFYIKKPAPATKNDF